MTRGPARIIDVCGDRLGRAIQETDYLRKNLKRPVPYQCWQLKIFRRFNEVPETSARCSTFTKHVDTVTPPMTCGRPDGHPRRGSLSNNCLQSNTVRLGPFRPNPSLARVSPWRETLLARVSPAPTPPPDARSGTPRGALRRPANWCTERARFGACARPAAPSCTNRGAFENR